MPGQSRYWRDIGRLLGIGIQSKALGHLPYEYLPIIRSRSNDPIVEWIPASVSLYDLRNSYTTDQSVSKTGAVCPRNSGICSGRRPFSLSGITAKAPPPLASQLTARYSGFALTSNQLPNNT
jgi:hypothetical protein